MRQVLEQPALNKISSLDKAQCIDGDGAKAKCTKTLMPKYLRVIFIFSMKYVVVPQDMRENHVPGLMQGA